MYVCMSCMCTHVYRYISIHVATHTCRPEMIILCFGWITPTCTCVLYVCDSGAMPEDHGRCDTGREIANFSPFFHQRPQAYTMARGSVCFRSMSISVNRISSLDRRDAWMSAFRTPPMKMLLYKLANFSMSSYCFSEHMRTLGPCNETRIVGFHRAGYEKTTSFQHCREKPLKAMTTNSFCRNLPKIV